MQLTPSLHVRIRMAKEAFILSIERSLTFQPHYVLMNIFVCTLFVFFILMLI